MAVLLDTTCFIALERQKLPLSALGAALADRAVAVSAVTASELLVGVHMADSQSRRARRSAFVEALLESLPIMPFDLQCARIHAQLRAQLRADGVQVGAHDLLIAATALAHGLSVCTDNVRDFNRIPGLGVVMPQWDAESSR